MEDSFSSMSLITKSDSRPIESSKARMSTAVRKFEESYTAYITSKAKGSPIPSVTLKQIVSSYEVTLQDSDVSGRGDTFSKAVQRFLLESIIEESQPHTELGKKTKGVAESTEKFIRRVGDFAGKLLPLATIACGLAAAIGDASPIISPLKAIANGTALILQLAQKEKDRGEEFTLELDRISYQSRRVFEMQKLPRESLNPLLLEKSLDLMTEIINFMASSLKYWKHGFFKNITKTVLLGPEIWQTAIKALHLAYEEYDQALLLQIASSIESQRTQFQEAAIEKKDDAFLQWLAPSIWEVEAQLLANRSQRTEGTLGWVLELEEFRMWRVGDIKNSLTTPNQTLWITGLPGTGKSTICAYLYDLLAFQYPDDIILHFFCKSGTPGLTTTYNIVRTLCYQLTRKDDFYRRCLRDMPELPKPGQAKNLALLFNTLITDPLSKGPQGSDIIILLDGLDELEDTKVLTGPTSYDSKTEIELLLEQIVSIPKVKLLITSRSSPELNKVLSTTGVTRHLTWGDNSKDIKRYVYSRVAKSPKLASGFQQIERDPITFFGERSNGIFLWVALVLDMLERTISSKSFSSALEAVPPTMNNVYDQILDRALQSGNYNWIREILGWTLILPGPFTMQQMKTAVELSMDDEIIDLEGFLRSECGSLLNLVPALGSNQSLEDHIGHETFQAYLTNPANSHVKLFAANIAHGKAVLGCLRYLMSEPSSINEAFRLHALTRWRWHLRHSVGFGERGFAEPLTALETGIPLPAKLSQEILVSLYRFLTSHKVDQWLKYYLHQSCLSLEHNSLFNEVYHTCIEVSAWYRVNQSSLKDYTVLVGSDIEPESIISWCNKIPNLQCIVDKLWPRSCHVWLWNTCTDWMSVTDAYEALVNLDIWANHPEILVETKEAVALLKQEERIIEENETSEHKMSGRLCGNLSLRYANSCLLFEKEVGERCHFDAIAEAGGFDTLSGVCQSNLAVACFFLNRHSRIPEADFLKESLARIQEALDEDPEGNPRDYETLGYIYKFQGQNDLSLHAWQRGIDIDPQNLTACREEYYQLKKGMLVDKSNGNVPDYDRAIIVLEEAIKEDPRHANDRWFHQLADLYKEKGDLEGARRTYKANIEFDPSWNSLWKDVAKTYIDYDVFEKTRKFDWRGFCDALTDATIADPKSAREYWEVWLDQAKDMREYQHFDIAVDMLQYGVEKTSSMKTQSEIQGRPLFEFLLGETFCSMAKFELAVPYLEDALRHLQFKPNTDLYKSLGHAYMFSSQYQDALAVFKKWSEISPNSANAYKGAGEVNFISTNLSKAIKEYKTAIRLQESWAIEREGRRGFPNSLDKYLGEWYVDLGVIYERLSRPEQARSCFEKALPHAEYTVQKVVLDRTEGPHPQGVFVHHSEGRAHANLAWLYERLYPSDSRAEDEYKLALWVFKTAVFIEDDFLEEAEYTETEANLARVGHGELWVFPGVEADTKLRERQTARTYRVNWGVNLERRKRGTRESMMRGN